MKLTVAFLISALLVLPACRTDYDIQEVASPQHLGTDHNDDCDECDHENAEHSESDHEHHDADTAEPDSLQEESDEHNASVISGSDRHVHDAGQRNHGTGWFFNQPWAASFIWGKMIRDSVILLVLSAAVVIVSGYLRKRRR